MSNTDLFQSIYSCLESTQFLALSTFGNDETWTCPVFFAYENNLTLYAISQPSSKHMHNLKKNPKVSVAIYSTAQNPLEGVQGIQMQATAKIVPDDEVESAFEIYYKRSPRDVVENASEPARTKGENAEWKFIKIEPLEVYYFNSELFGHERRRVVELANLREEG